MGISTCPPVHGSLPTQTLLWFHVMPRTPHAEFVLFEGTCAVQTTVRNSFTLLAISYTNRNSFSLVTHTSHTQVWKVQTNSMSTAHLDLARVLFQLGLLGVFYWLICWPRAVPCLMSLFHGCHICIFCKENSKFNSSLRAYSFHGLNLTEEELAVVSISSRSGLQCFVLLFLSEYF